MARISPANAQRWAVGPPATCLATPANGPVITWPKPAAFTGAIGEGPEAASSTTATSAPRKPPSAAQPTQGDQARRARPHRGVSADPAPASAGADACTRLGLVPNSTVVVERRTDALMAAASPPQTALRHRRGPGTLPSRGDAAPRR